MEKHKPYAAIHESNLSRTAQPSEDGDVYLVGGTARHHAAKTHGCSPLGTLFARVLLAAPRGERRVLPDLHVVRDRFSVRLEDHAPRQSRR